MLVSAKLLYHIRLANVSTTLKISQRLDCLDIMFVFILCGASALVMLRTIISSMLLIVNKSFIGVSADELSRRCIGL